MTGYRMYARIQGRVRPITFQSLTSHNVVCLGRLISGDDQIESTLVKGDAVDCIYIHYDQSLRGVQHRFRVNIKGLRALGGGGGIGITIRQIAQKAPTPEELGVEQDIIDGFTPNNGIVIVSGPTGSGKSTLFASLLGYICEQNERDFIIGTCEAPIEYTFDHLNMDRVVIYQSSVADVGGNFTNFDSGVRASLRSGTNGTVIGELRDLETIRAALSASNTGQVVWGTLHVNSVADMPSRIVNVFPSNEMNKVRVEFYANARFLMCQRLVPCIKPGIARIPVKEWLRLTTPMARQLISSNPHDELKLLQDFVISHGMPMSRYAKKLLDEGFISDETYLQIVDGE